jgi:uncharacterized Zn finger protein
MSGVTWFDDDELRRLAGARSYERGIGYVDAIADLEELPDGVVATVHGSAPYRVRLSDHGNALVGACSCPHAQGGAFCKHCVAVGLVLLGDAPVGPPAEPATPKRKRRSRRTVDLRAYLESVDAAELVDLLLELAADDPTLHRRLALRAAVAGDVDVAELRRLVDTLRKRGFIEYASSFAYAGKAEDVLDVLATLVPAQAAAAGPLYRRTVQHLTAALTVADDSSGAIGSALHRAVDGYAAACGVAPPDAIELAHWLVDFLVDGPGWPDIRIAQFAEPLGDDGLAAYWKYLTALHEGTGRDAAGSSTLRRLREDYLQTVTGDVDALVALYAEDLPQPYRYVQIAQTLRGAHRVDEAIGWLERGRREATWPDTRIDEHLAELYAETGRDTDALEARWRVFTDLPEVSTHHALLDAADRVSALADTSERAVAHLRERAARGGYAADPLVIILLATGDVDAAWAAAGEFACSSPQLLKVAERHGRIHPAAVIPAYAQAVESAIARKSRGSYAEAVTLVGVLKDLHERAGTDFAAYLGTLRETHRRKTSLLAELARARL